MNNKFILIVAILQLQLSVICAHEINEYYPIGTTWVQTQIAPDKSYITIIDSSEVVCDTIIDTVKYKWVESTRHYFDGVTPTQYTGYAIREVGDTIYSRAAHNQDIMFYVFGIWEAGDTIPYHSQHITEVSTITLADGKSYQCVNTENYAYGAKKIINTIGSVTLGLLKKISVARGGQGSVERLVSFRRHGEVIYRDAELETLLKEKTTKIKEDPRPDTPASQMEKLDRGLIAVPYSTGRYFVSWRLLGTDDNNTTFELLKNGESIKKDIYQATSMIVNGSSTDKFQVVTYQNGSVVSTSPEVSPWAKSFLELQLDRPANGAHGGSYSPNDCSVGDVDGDGQYEIIVKWDPSNSKDNSQDGITDNVYLDCYKLDGTKLWRIDLGGNIRAGAHYTQFMVYDFDGNGKAEMMCKTAPGSKDAAGNFVNQVATDDRIKAADNNKSWITASGRMDGGHEYLTVFNGETGKAVHTITYYPNRNTKAELSEADGTFNWAEGKTDTHGYNRGDRYLAAVAYLGGQDANPSGVFCRGYYSYAYVWAVDFDGAQLKHRWLHRSDSRTQWSVVDANMQESAKVTAPKATSESGSNTMFANGNHNLSVADVDGDGKDEILWGSAAVDDDGRLLYATGFGHGDAIHLGDLNPDRKGLEVFQVHEEKGTYSWDIHDAATGEILMKGGQSGVDNGRGLAADIVADTRGYEFWSSYGGFDSNSYDRSPFDAIYGNKSGSKAPSMNFRIYWDGDPLDELLDGTGITKYNTSGDATTLKLVPGRSGNGSPASCNGTKATPNLSADIFGDWREEVIFWNSTNSSTLNIYTSTTTTDYRVPTLMHDHVYRMGVAWQNVAYNQPPHLGYYLPDYIDSFQGNEPTGIIDIKTGNTTDTKYYNLMGLPVDKPSNGIYILNGKKIFVK